MSTESLTTQVFGVPRPGYYRVYYVIQNHQDLSKLEQANPVVLMFLTNNEPCKAMARPFWNMAVAKRKQAIFCQLDVDKFRDIAEQYRVEAMPTFVLKKDGNEIARVVGLKKDELNTNIGRNI